MREKILEVYSGNGVYTKATAALLPKGIALHLLKAYEPTAIGNYTVTALPARHAPGDDAFIYIIEGDSTLLYAHDTGYFYDEVFAYIEKSKIHFDLVSFDCTNVDIPISDEGTHMGIDNIERVAARLTALRAIDEKTIKIINHFSHNANPLHHLLEDRICKKGYLVSYDGMTVECL